MSSEGVSVRVQADASGLVALGIISTWFGLLLIILTAVSGFFAQGGEPAVTNPVVAGMRFVLVALILGSALRLAVPTGCGLKLAALPLIINFGTFIIIQLVPFDTLWQDVWFRWQLSRLQRVVSQVENGAIQSDAAGMAVLPLRDRHLSEGGQILIDRSGGITRVFFYTSRRTAWNFSGYFYRADDKPPQPADFGGRWHQIRHKRLHWYHCSSY